VEAREQEGRKEEGVCNDRRGTLSGLVAEELERSVTIARDVDPILVAIVCVLYNVLSTTVTLIEIADNGLIRYDVSFYRE
jgi:hypothetical protein